ncbi:MAG: hypothetical protein ACP5OG_05315 [Candidatus Nanoarchaeia archaeon]
MIKHKNFLQAAIVASSLALGTLTGYNAGYNLGNASAVREVNQKIIDVRTGLEKQYKHNLEGLNNWLSNPYIDKTSQTTKEAMDYVEQNKGKIRAISDLVANISDTEL